MSLDATAQACPASPYGDTHHLTNISHALGVYALRCAYCGMSQAQLNQPTKTVEPACPVCGEILDLAADEQEAAHEVRVHLDAAHPQEN